jgi:hypothetical protein
VKGSSKRRNVMNARRKSGRNVTVRLMLVALMLGVVAISSGTRTSAREASEQVVFSGVGFFGAGSAIEGSPFGFWIWCESESENPYAGRCQGAMYIYALGITKHVEGEIGEIETPDGDEYLMEVHSRDGVLLATLQNVAPNVKGPKNTVNAVFTAPAGVGGGSSTNSVVNVTGPHD